MCDLPSAVLKWSSDHVKNWLHDCGHSDYVISLLCDEHKIDGKALLTLTENDLKSPPVSMKVLGDIKRLSADIRILQQHNLPSLEDLGLSFSPTVQPAYSRPKIEESCETNDFDSEGKLSLDAGLTNKLPGKKDGRATHLPPEFSKTLLSMAYLFVVTWITAFVMVIVHDRVPDMKKYPPLPDIFLDNVPTISWAFHMCEVTGSLLLLIWVAVLITHKHRFILLRRFFALSGTVFLLRCITMLITSLSVPGTHLECNPRPYGELWAKIQHAYVIWRGAGMSIQGVRTCGDYMFSGHTVALTMLNFFITEYTPRRMYFLHTFSWLLNMFGIFFILSAHEHYSIDVFIAFYITSRLFLYYHTLANNQALMQRDSGRTRVWFPLFSFFESSVDRIVPNEFEWPITSEQLKAWVTPFMMSLLAALIALRQKGTQLAAKQN
ncbi:sphingomyelin synthase-related protein 1-like isoform X2 [Neocloeon triangulifer]|uniref:sphingomyelin synthase-related protein 1-like isoform X2 n=1 Tax=Neocloeon triangulifer TaxID=2078957 RepID=UPI00286F052A|nr:sphingomyelin synthase-related protein 1-like isoform X2 [Neocloeon triangulifer]